MEKTKQRFNSTLRSWVFFKLAGPDEIHLRVCRELDWSDLTAQGNYFENRVRIGKISENRKKTNHSSYLQKNEKRCRSVNFTSITKEKKYCFKYSNIWTGTKGYESASADLSRTNHVKQPRFFLWHGDRAVYWKGKYLYFRKVSDSVFYDIFLCNPGSSWNCHMVGTQLIGVLCIKTNCSAGRM